MFAQIVFAVVIDVGGVPASGEMRPGQPVDMTVLDPVVAGRGRPHAAVDPASGVDRGGMISKARIEVIEGRGGSACAASRAASRRIATGRSGFEPPARARVARGVRDFAAASPRPTPRRTVSAP